MDNLIPKSNAQIKKQMLFWFHKYHGKPDEQFDGTEAFTLFDKLSIAKKNHYSAILDLEPEELPVFLLTMGNDEVIINTTRKFVRLTAETRESIHYREFRGHNGFRRPFISTNKMGEHISWKSEGYIADFGLLFTNGQEIYWKVPTGKPGYAFWNITTKCDLIGRKYI